jgi:RimJ/RimL family protein N-acetyltransferase
MLIGNKIILRPLKIEDLEKTHGWRNNLELIKLVQGIRFPKTLEMDKEWFDNALNDKSNRNIYFGIDEIETNDFIGIIQLNNIDYISGTAIWGFVIGDKIKHGKGYSVEAPNLLFNYAFNILNLRKIFGYPISYNNATLRMHQKIGKFTEEGRLKKHIFFDNEYHDVIIMSLFKEDFLSTKSK